VDSTGPQPEGNNSTVIGDTPSSAIGDGDPNAQQEIIRQVVPAVVVTASVVIAGVVVLVVLLKRRDKKKKSAVQIKVPLQRMNSRTISSRSLNRNTSKYGIERNTINSNPDKTWEPPAESEFAEVDKMPFEMSKKLDFNVGSNQFKVGQQYTDVITITARDKKSSTSAGVPFAFHPPTTKKLKMEFNPSSGIAKKGKPVEVEVTMTMQMTTEIDVDIGLECSSEKKHSFITLHLMSELSSFIDLDEVTLEGGSAAKPVGDGAFGVVYKGKYRQQEVAVKMLKMQDMPEEMLDEFDREVDLMNKLRHKNIVQFVGASKVVGRFALITEFIDKGNMANVILTTSKTLSFAFKLRVALDAARAMFFLHENKILHRDLKLDNLLCVSTNPDDPVVAKLTDFGTSRAVSEKASNSYTVGVGTPMYMSPEILAKKPYDTKSDVFSYGVMLWILYCQKEPYKHIEHSWEIARFVMEGNREKIPKDCPSEFKELIEQCWSQEPNQRPEFQEIVTRLEQMVESCNEVQPSPRSPRSKKSIK
jgi:tRNA A-37 threonylcarbamoyl transferase component Bud32